MSEVEMIYLGNPRYTILMKKVPLDPQMSETVINKAIIKRQCLIMSSGKWEYVIPYNVAKNCIFKVKKSDIQQGTF